MPVPSSRLVEAYTALREALGKQSTAPTADSMRSALAAFLERLSDRLAPDTAMATPVGSVLNLTA